jgi:ribosome-associated protein
MRDVPIRTDTIDLDQFLKLADLASSGGEAKMLIREGMVLVNGAPETRRRRTLHVGDEVSIDDSPTARVASGG